MFIRGLRLGGGQISVLVSIALSAACAGTSDSKSGEAGAGGAAGAASNPASGGSSGADAALPAQGAFSVLVTAPSATVNGTACPVSGTKYGLGSPPPTALDPGQSIVSDHDGSVISCSVRGRPPLTFGGSLHGTTSTGDPVTLVLTDGTLAGNEGTANLSFFAPQLASQFTSSTPCRVSVVAGQVKPGSIWASFSCDVLSSPPSGLCSASGVFVLENCDGS
jgi:hypothetical protein